MNVITKKSEEEKQIGGIDIRDIAGQRYIIKHLKPIGKRIRNRLLAPEKRQPWVNLLISEQGVKYKMLKVDDKANLRLANIIKMKDIYDSFDFVPEIVLADRYTILLKYVDGAFPNFSDKIFSKNFGKNMAVLHNMNVGETNKDDYIREILKCKDFLISKNAISKKIADKIYEIINSLQPAALRTSMTYSNMNNKENFIMSEDSFLWFIDLGSFKGSRVTDDGLFGDRLFKSIDEDAFWEGYSENGGTDYLKKNRHFLKLSQNVRKGAKYLQRYYTLPITELREKRRRLKRSKWMINEIVNEIGIIEKC